MKLSDNIIQCDWCGTGYGTDCEKNKGELFNADYNDAHICAKCIKELSSTIKVIPKYDNDVDAIFKRSSNRLRNTIMRGIYHGGLHHLWYRQKDNAKLPETITLKQLEELVSGNIRCNGFGARLSKELSMILSDYKQ